MKDQIVELQNVTTGKSIDSEKLTQQLQESRIETANALNEIRELKNDVMIYKKRCDEKGAEIGQAIK